MKKAIFVFVAIMLTFVLSSCDKYVPQSGYDTKYKIELLDLSGKIVESYDADFYRYLETAGGIRVYIGKNDGSDISCNDIVKWYGSYRITRKEVLKTELERP